MKEMSYEKASKKWGKIFRIPSNILSHFRVDYEPTYNLPKPHVGGGIYQISDNSALITHGIFYRNNDGVEVPKEILEKYEEKAREICRERNTMLKKNCEEFFAELAQL